MVVRVVLRPRVAPAAHLQALLQVVLLLVTLRLVVYPQRLAPAALPPVQILLPAALPPALALLPRPVAHRSIPRP